MTELEKYKHLFSDKDLEVLRYFAEHNFLWWETPTDAMNKYPLRLLANAMCMANSKETFEVLIQLNFEIFKLVLQKARPGWFEPKSWYFWHYVAYGKYFEVSPVPVRFPEFKTDYRFFKGCK